MSEGQFWQDVADSIAGDSVEPCALGGDLAEYPYDDEDSEQMSYQQEPCAECGEVGPCGYDNEGRPMIHVIADGHQD